MLTQTSIRHSSFLQSWSKISCLECFFPGQIWQFYCRLAKGQKIKETTCFQEIGLCCLAHDRDLDIDGSPYFLNELWPPDWMWHRKRSRTVYRIKDEDGIKSTFNIAHGIDKAGKVLPLILKSSFLLMIFMANYKNIMFCHNVKQSVIFRRL